MPDERRGLPRPGGIGAVLGAAALPLAATAASADDGNCVGTNVSTWTGGGVGLQDLYNAAASTTTYCLTGDITASSGAQLNTPSGATLEIDLNGHTLTITDPGAEKAAIEVTSGEGVIISDTSTAGGGVLDATGGAGGNVGTTASGAGVGGGGGIGGAGGVLDVAGTAPTPAPTPVSKTGQAGQTPAAIGTSAATQSLSWILTDDTGDKLGIEFGQPIQIAPANFSAVPGDGQVNLSWDAVTATPPVTGYVVSYKKTTDATWTVYDVEPYTTDLTRTVTPLDNGIEYEFRVAAINNAFGPGVPSTVNATPVAPATIPDAPDTPTVTAGESKATVNWVAPFDGGSAITGYTIAYGPVGATPTLETVGASPLEATITGLTNDTEYEFSIVATNAVGDSAASPVTQATPTAAPNPSTPEASLSVVVAAAGDQITVRATGFEANEELSIWVHSDPIRLWSGNATAEGTLNETVTLPADLAPGKHWIEIRRENGAKSLRLDLTISDSLKKTGATDSLPWIGGFAALLLLAAAGTRVIRTPRYLP